MANVDSVLASAATSASYNIILQLLFRLLTFVLNAFILRYISNDTLGVVNVRLTLLYSTILFVSREAFRRACLSKSAAQTWQSLVNLLWCIIPIGCITSILLSIVWTTLIEQPNDDSIPYYKVAVIGYALSAILEMLSEPLFVIGQVLLYVRLKVVIEGVALMVRCFLTVVLIFVFPNANLVAFTIAQLSLTVVTSLLYYTYFLYVITISKSRNTGFPFKSVVELLPRREHKKPWFNSELVQLTWSFFKQSFFKQLLTEGEKYMMTIFDVITFADQGVYDVICNLGSLLPRFVFLPLEDSSYLLFTQTLQRKKEENLKDNSIFAADILGYLLKIVFLLGLLLCVYSLGYSNTVLHIYGGSTLSSGTGPMLLQCYGVYVVLLAVNGITEAFVFATMNKNEINKYNHKMFLFSIVFLLSSLLLVKQFGSIGFIFANCFNMSIRITHSVNYISTYFSCDTQNPLLEMFPSKVVVISFLFSLAASVISKNLLSSIDSFKWTMVDICVGGVCVLFNIACILKTEKRLIYFLKDYYNKRRSNKQKSQ